MTDTRRQITGSAGDRYRRGRGRGTASGKRSVRAWCGLIGAAYSDDSRIGIYSGGP